MESSVMRLQIFDLDGTLMNTFGPEEGKPMWEKYYGKPFPWNGWWGRPESLDLNVFDIKPFPSVLKQLKKELITPDTYVLVLTSRMEKLRPQVEAVLAANNINVDKVDMKRAEGDKGVKVMRYVQQFPELKIVNVYEDRDVDIEAYERIRPQMPEGVEFNIYLANQGTLALTESSRSRNLLSIIREEVKKIVNEISFDDIKVSKPGWAGNPTVLQIGDEQQRGNILPKNELPENLYHVTINKDKILSDGYLKAQKMGGGFGGGRIEGISATSNKEDAETYYWGMVLAILLSQSKTRDDLVRILDWWIDKQKSRVNGDLSIIKKVFFDDFDSREHINNFMDAVTSARKLMHLVSARTDEKLKDPVITGGIDRLVNINLNNVVIFIINKNEISDKTPIITGTDTEEIRILGDVPVKNYYQP